MHTMTPSNAHPMQDGMVRQAAELTQGPLASIQELAQHDIVAKWVTNEYFALSDYCDFAIAHLAAYTDFTLPPLTPEDPSYEEFKNEPTTPLGAFVSRIAQFTRYEHLPQESLVLATVYIKRLLLNHADHGLVLSQANVRRIFVVAMILANKWLCDKALKNVYWVIAGETLTYNQLSGMEIEVLGLLDWDLNVSPAEFCLAIREGIQLRDQMLASIPGPTATTTTTIVASDNSIDTDSDTMDMDIIEATSSSSLLYNNNKSIDSTSNLSAPGSSASAEVEFEVRHQRPRSSPHGACARRDTKDSSDADWHQ